VHLLQLDGVWHWLPRWLDVARYALWFAFVLHLLGQARSDGGHRSMLVRRLTWVAIALTVVAAFTPHFMPMTVLAVFGLVLIEQLFRNLPADARWSAKPICLGLAGTLLFDVYLFSEAALFNGVDEDVAAARGFVHALMVPLLILPSARHRNWISKIQVSRQVVFHSATLMMAGLYLLFISSLGYYVRYFGGHWGRVLQVALVFLAVVALVALGLSGTLRARVRVWLGKHFLRYRYDYREEWLKLHPHLDESHPAPGTQPARDPWPGRHGGKPGGGLVAAQRRTHAFRAGGALERAAVHRDGAADLGVGAVHEAHGLGDRHQGVSKPAAAL
jgi:putative PEP-CTERM system histidine kinase